MPLKQTSSRGQTRARQRPRLGRPFADVLEAERKRQGRRRGRQGGIPRTARPTRLEQPRHFLCRFRSSPEGRRRPGPLLVACAAGCRRPRTRRITLFRGRPAASPAGKIRRSHSHSQLRHEIPEERCSIGTRTRRGLYGLRRFDDAADAFLRTIAIAPEIEQPYVFLGKFLDQIPLRVPELTKKFIEYETANPSKSDRILSPRQSAECTVGRARDGAEAAGESPGDKRARCRRALRTWRGVRPHAPLRRCGARIRESCRTRSQ